MTHARTAAPPRVLVLALPPFNRVNGTGITLTNLFQGWPRDRIAMIHGGDLQPSTEICDAYFELTAREIRRLGPLLGMRPRGSSSPATSGGGLGVVARRIVFGNMLPDSGRLSSALEEWIATFKPDVLYTILGSNAMMDLASAIRARFSTRLVVHFMDDWPSIVYRGGLLSSVPRRRKEHLLRSLVDSADVRLGISPAMCREYGQRFGKPFEAFMSAVDVAQYRARRTTAGDPNEILYVGSIHANVQLNALVDCCRAAVHLQDRGVRLTILTPADSLTRHRDAFPRAPNVTIGESPPDGPAFIERIRSAGALLLPVNFDQDSVTFIRYSMPTKVPAYLASGTPILAFGPADVAQIEYARDEQWALVAAERDPTALEGAMVRVLEDAALRARISQRALLLASERHALGDVRSRFHAAISALA